MKHCLYKVRSGFFRLFLSPKEYLSNGVDGFAKIRALETLRFGDIVLRGFNHGFEHVLVPGDYSSGGVYDGDEGIIYQSATGMHQINILDFLECDRFQILRVRHGSKRRSHQVRVAVTRAESTLGAGILQMNGLPREFHSFQFLADAFRVYNLRKFHPAFGLAVSKRKFYLSESFTRNDKFTSVMTYPPKDGYLKGTL